MSWRYTSLRHAERVLWIVGCLLVAMFVIANVRGSVLSRADVQRFERARRAAAVELATPAPDTGEWSSARIEAYEATSAEATGLPMAVLEIRSLGLIVGVHRGTDEPTLNRGVGWIEGTARPGEAGNIGIAGHRDGFFRALREIEPGDPIELVTLDGVRRYRVSDTWIVSPDEVAVLAPTDEPALTLVTCYPFHYVGAAPQRFIVRARHLEFEDTETTMANVAGGTAPFAR